MSVSEVTPRGREGLNILYGTNYNIINGNLFVEFIRFFDINNMHSF